MRVIVTGGTGFVGAEVVRQLAARPDVAQVSCLGRRPVVTSAPNVETVIHQDFATYDAPLARRLAEHDGCIWALGGKASDAADPAAYERVTYTFTVSFARALAAHLSRPFRFVYVSGMGADPSESARLSWERETRHLKGRVERVLAELTVERPLFHATAFRPGGILPRHAPRLVDVLLAPIVVRVDRLAQVLIGEVARGAADRFHVVSNREIRRRSVM